MITVVDSPNFFDYYRHVSSSSYDMHVSSSSYDYCCVYIVDSPNVFDYYSSKNDIADNVDLVGPASAGVERYDELGLVKVLYIIYYILNIIYCIYIMYVERYDELGLVG